jgi:hypothetical protein
MKILVVLGGALASSDVLAAGYRAVVPGILQKGMESNGITPFAGHEIVVALAEEAIDAYFEHAPDCLIFAGTYSEGKGVTPRFVLAERMLTRDLDKRMFLYTNPITVPPFNREENFFLMTDTDGMAGWLGLS